MHTYLIVSDLSQKLRQHVWDAREHLPKDYSTFPRPHITLLRFESPKRIHKKLISCVNDLKGRVRITPFSFEQYGRAIVLECDAPFANKHHNTLFESLKQHAARPLRHVGEEYSPHITFCYSKKLPENLPDKKQFSGIAPHVLVAHKTSERPYEIVCVHAL